MRRVLAGTVVALGGCGAVFGIGDLPPLELDPDAAADARVAIAPDGAEPADALDARPPASDAGLDPDADPRWALWPIPPDDPPAASFVTENAGTDRILTDLVTQLRWQDPEADAIRALGEAQDYCASLVLGGRDDWRVPTRIEAASILRIGPAVFENAPSSFVGRKTSGDCHWTSSIASTGTPWAVAGDVGLNTLGPCYVRCVRGAPELGAPRRPTYDVTADSVLEPRTGLVWERTPPGAATSRDAAAARCAALTLRGRVGRLPTIKELLSLVAEEKKLPAIDPAFGGNLETLYWSSTVSNGSGWLVGFDDGTTRRFAESQQGLTALARCVATL